MIGQTLGHYRILEKIGAGGMGVVYRAHDERLERDVALKVLPAGTLADEAARQRFHKEALALSKLNHPNIATIHDFDTQDGVDFLVMEHIPGITLNEKLMQGPLGEKEIARMGMQMAEGLAAAHEQGVIHRDLKPGNLRVTPDARLKILDFGLAKLVRPMNETAPPRSLTETEARAGTPLYMAPEQQRGEKADSRTDIYAAGLVLLQMATGELPRVRGRALGGKVSPGLERIVTKCLEDDPELRYQSAKELLVDLRRLGAPAPPRRLSRRAVLVATAALAALVVLVGLNVGGLRDQLARLMGIAGPPRIQSLAVLPLENLSGDPEQEYFADGMTEAVITDLSKISALKVISRTSVMQYKGVKKPLPEIARELHVDAVVEGSVLRAGDRVRITAQLIHAPTDTHLWAESYERDLRDVLALQSEVARAIATEIQVKLTPQEQTRLASARPVNPEAHEAYLLGRFYWNTRTQEGLEKALAYFQQALEKDPHYAPVYAGIADYYSILPFYSRSSPKEVFPKAKAAALKALEIDNTLAEAHAALAYTMAYYDWDWAGAEREFKRAIELNPNSNTVHQAYSRLLSVTGRLDEAMAEMRRAQELDPLSLLPTGNLAMLAYFGGRYDRAIAQLQKTLEMDPKFPVAHWGIGLAYEQKGQYERAIAAFEKAKAIAPDSLNTKASLGHAYALQGKRREAEKIIAELKDQSKQKYVSSYQVAVIYAGLGERDRALEWLEKAYEERSTLLAYFEMDPRLDPLRGEPRFQALLRRMNFPE